MYFYSKSARNSACKFSPFFWHRRIFWCALLFALWGGARASSQSYRLEGDRFFQRLEWDGDPNVYRYEVSIEGADGFSSSYETKDNFLEVSLRPGEYTFTVDVYNLLDLFEYKMRPVRFTVLQAFQPSVASWTPHVFVPSEGGEVSVTGENIVRGAEIYLERKGKNEKRITPSELFIEESGTRARFMLPPGEVEKGAWTLRIVNPGGLSAAQTGFRIRNTLKLGVDISAGYSPLIPLRLGREGSFFDILAGGSFLFDTVFAESFYPAGANLKLTWMPFQCKVVSFGFSLEPHWADLSTQLDHALFNAHLAGAGLSFLVQFNFFGGALALDLSAGGGALSFVLFSTANYRQNNSGAVNGGEEFFLGNVFFPYIDFNLSLKIFPLRFFFLELGASWNITLPFDYPDMLFLRPYAAAGFSF